MCFSFIYLSQVKLYKHLKTNFEKKIARHSLCVLSPLFYGAFLQAPHKHWQGYRESLCGNTKKMKGQRGRRIWYLSSWKAHF